MDAGIVDPGNIGATAAPCLEFSASLSPLWRADERTRTADLISSYECAVRRCRGLHEVANPPYLSLFHFSTLLRVAPYCARSGIRVVSIEV